jgi:tripartite ATP-independent transporter DctM subunit
LIQEQIDLTPALNIPRSYVVAAIVVGLALILIMALLRLIDGEPRIVLPVIAGAVAVAAIGWFGRGVFANFGNFNLVIFFVFVVGACVAVGIPIAFAFGVGALSYLALTTTVPLNTVVGRMDEGISNLVLLAVPLFVLLGLLMESAGIAKRLVDFIASLVGHLRGGLSIVLLGAMYLVSGISGSKAADMAAVAPVLFPEMERRGQPRNELVALLAGSAAMAETIPPSLVLIIIGSVTGTSIAALFTAGLLPAFIAAIALMIVALLRSRNDRTELAKRPSISRILRYFVIALPGLLLPLLIRFFVLQGIATATEVSVVGIVYTMLVGIFIYRELDWRRMYPILRETAALSGAILLIIATATSMGWALTQSGFAQQLADTIGHAPGGAGGFMALSVVLFIVLGSVLEGIPAVVLFGPLLFPIAQALGINEVQYAIVAVLAMGIGLFAPPVGLGYYGACVIGKCDPDTAFGRVIPYLGALVVALILVAAIPWLSLGFLHKIGPS